MLDLEKSRAPYRAKTDAPICETHDELVTAAYEYDGGHKPHVSGCTTLVKGGEVKVLNPKATDDPNAVQVDTQGHIGWTKSYYLDEPAVKANWLLTGCSELSLRGASEVVCCRDREAPTCALKLKGRYAQMLKGCTMRHILEKTR